MKPYFVIANLVLSAAAVFLGVQSFYRYTTGRMWIAPGAAQEVRAAETGGNPRAQPWRHYQPIIARNLFGPTAPKASGQAAAIDIDKLKETGLKLKLWGTVTGGDQ